jgi:hypothetical protein
LVPVRPRPQGGINFSPGNDGLLNSGTDNTGIANIGNFNGDLVQVVTSTSVPSTSATAEPGFCASASRVAARTQQRDAAR